MSGTLPYNTRAGSRYEQQQRETATSKNSGKPLQATTAEGRYEQQQREAATRDYKRFKYIRWKV
jgi:hypothetical protein